MPELVPPPIQLLDRYAGTEILPLYSTTVVLEGGEARHGRASGHAVSDSGELDLHLRIPRELGGPGGGTNPEQLFAAGYAACFHGAMNLIAAKSKIPVGRSKVTASVTFGRDPSDGLFLLTATIGVDLPDLDTATAEHLVHETEKVCPYSKMARQGIQSTVTVV